MLDNAKMDGHSASVPIFQVSAVAISFVYTFMIAISTTNIRRR